MIARGLLPQDRAPLADLFERRWHDAHGDISPPELLAARTHEDFAARLRGFSGDIWVIGPPGAPQGFVAVKGNHIDQLYVDVPLEGTGAARVLQDHALSALAARGHATAELWCHAANGRAAAFYRRTGWRERGKEEVMLDSASGPVPLICIVFDRALP